MTAMPLLADDPFDPLDVRDGVVDLAVEPPTDLALRVALDAAVAVAGARPGPRLVDWLDGLDNRQQPWDGRATQSLLRVLREGSARSWRFLATTGVLARWLPELAEALRRRQADSFEPDPAAAFRWPLVERVGAAADDQVLLAALAIDCGGAGPTPTTTAGRLVRRLGLGRAAEQEIAVLAAEHGLLRASARRPDGIGEEAVLRIAAHLATPDRARALHVLATALVDDASEREHIDALHDLVQRVLRRAEVTGPAARTLVERHRTEATRLVGTDMRAAARVAAAPLAYLLAQESGDVARHCELLEPLPAANEARVAVTPDPTPGHWRLDVAGRDRPGLLAAVTGVLAAFDLDVAGAVVATWDDGGALESFVIRATTAPDTTTLRAALEEALAAPLASPPVPDAEVAFDDEASPWHTLCDVRAPDRPGLLHALAVAFAVAGVDVHAARVATLDGLAVDRFDVSDRKGRKLTGAAEEAIRTTLAAGVTVPRRGWRRRHP